MAAPTSPAVRGSIRDRVRAPTAEELEAIPWLPLLTATERRRAEAAIVVGEAEVGDVVCRIGRAPTYWFGVIEGLLKMSNDNADGSSVTHSGLSAGGWFGESHEAQVLKAATVPDQDERLTAVRTLLAEEARMGMMVGVAVGWALAQELSKTERLED